VRVLIAPDKFKGSLSASEAAAAMRLGVLAVRPDAEIDTMPVADGGEGTGDVVVGLGGVRREIEVHGPLGDRVRASWVRLGDVAYIETSTACGLALVPQPSPSTALTSSSRGVGTLVRAAMDAGCRDIVLAVGGSACTDGGAGMMAELGVRFLDAAGAVLPDGGARLALLSAMDTSGLDPRLVDVTVVVACDVDNPLTGERGSAAVFAPQKGADQAAVRDLSAALETYGRHLDAFTGRAVSATPGAGAAGGIPASAAAFFGARSTSGSELLLDLLHFDDRAREADLVLTGEGSLDLQSLGGKAPMVVTRRARSLGIPVAVVAGRVDLGEDHIRAAGWCGIGTLLERAESPRDAFDRAAILMQWVTADVVRDALASA
jgi:glycerate kinase